MDFAIALSDETSLSNDVQLFGGASLVAKVRFLANMTSPTTRGVLVILGRLLMIGSLLFLATSIVEHYDEIPSIELNAASGSALLLAVALSFLVNAIGALAWGWLVAAGRHDVGQVRQKEYEARTKSHGLRRVQYRIAFRIWAMSNVAKYLPGNVFQYASRLALARRAGFPVGAVIVSMVLEAFLVCAAALILVLLGFLTNSLRFDYITQVVGQTTSAEYAIVIGVLLFVGMVAAYTFPNLRDRIFRNLSRVGVLPSVAALSSYVITFLVMGAAALVLLKAGWHLGDTVGWFELSCGYALAFILGYMVPGAPGGIGIREVIMVGLFSTTIGAGPVLGIAVLLRFASIVGDFLSFAVACSIREHAA